MRLGNVESLMWAGVALGILYFVAKFQRNLAIGLDVAGQAYNSVRTGATNLIETFFPLVNSSSMITHAVTFPNGARHAVPGETVDSAGFFIWQGARYRLLVNAQGMKIAVAS